MLACATDGSISGLNARNQSHTSEVKLNSMRPTKHDPIAFLGTGLRWLGLDASQVKRYPGYQSHPKSLTAQAIPIAARSPAALGYDECGVWAAIKRSAVASQRRRVGTNGGLRKRNS